MLMLCLSSLILILILSLALSSTPANVNSLSISNELTVKNKTSIWGCQKYTESVHCDLFRNAIEGNDTTQKSTLIKNITREPVYVDRNPGKAIEFIDGHREYVEIPQRDIYNSPQFSISFWLKKTDLSNQSATNGHIISHISNDKKNGWFFETTNSSDRSVNFVITKNDGDLTVTKDIPFSNSNFTNIAATFDGSHIGVYRNGNLIQIMNYSGNYSSAIKVPIHIGSAAYCDSCNRLTGIVSDVRLYNRAISSYEVKQLYLDTGKNSVNSPSLPINNGLTGHWTFDNNLNDSSPTKNPGQMFTLIVSMVSAPDGRIFISEKNTGKILIMKDEKLLEKPFAIINNTYVNWEQGLLGLAIDPHFNKNHFVYLYYTTIKGDGHPINRVIRLTDKESVAVNMTTILDNIPASFGYHSGGAMTFGPDNKLYITIGDATEHPYAQSKSVLVGKILRINPDGSIPKDNPFLNSPIYTLGHRNIFGIAFDNKTKIGIEDENGDVLYDEVNLIEKGGNYGFPTLQPVNINPQLSNSTIDIKPLRSYWHTVAPTQAIYYTGDRYPTLKNTFLHGTYTGKIYMIHIDNNTRSIDYEQHIEVNHFPFEPVLGITQSSQGYIYYSGYHLYKLENVSENGRPELFPLKFDSSKNIVIDNVKTKEKKYVIIDLHLNSNNTSAKSSFEYIKLQLPKSLIQNIKNITASLMSSKAETSEKTIPFTLDNKSLKYNDITIRIPLNETKIQMEININAY